MEADPLALAQVADYSLWSLFARATIVVKLVMLILVLASFWAWSIIVQKLITYREARAEAPDREGERLLKVIKCAFSHPGLASYYRSNSLHHGRPTAHRVEEFRLRAL